MGKKKNDIDILKVANKVKKGDAELLQQRNVQQALDEYGKQLSHKDKKLSTRKKLIILFSTLICVALISTLVIVLLFKSKTHIYPFIDYNIEQIVDDSVRMKKGSTVGDLPIKQVSGYRFDGWYADGMYTLRLDNNKELEDKMTVYAKYINVDNLTLTIDNVPTKLFYDYGLTLEEVLQKNNIDITVYNSCGWFTDADLLNPYNGVFEDGLHLYTKTATLSKLNFELNASSNNYIAVLDEHVNLEKAGNIVLPMQYQNGKVVDFRLQNCNMANLTIPYTITEISSNSTNNSTLESINLHINLTKLNDYAFENTKIETLALYNTITSFGVGIFKNSGIRKITINNQSITSLSTEMFAGCTLLEELDLSTCSKLNAIQPTSLDNCSSLTKLIIPESTLSIDFATIKTCLNLEVLKIADNHPLYDSRNNCNGLITKVDIIPNDPEQSTIIANTLVLACKTTIIPESVKVIATSAYSNHLGITNISIPSTVETIEDYAFENCANLISATIINENSMGVGCFKNCYALNQITLPSNLASLNESTFEGCSSLNNITLPETLTTIQKKAFTLSGLYSINIPKNVNDIDVAAFRKCDNLKFITVDTLNTTYDSRDYCNAIIKKDTDTLYIGCSNSSISNSVVAIGNSAFKDCTALKEIKILSNVTTIDVSAFEGCTSLEYIDLPIEVTKIGAYAFAGCTSLATANLPFSTIMSVPVWDPVTQQMLTQTIVINGKGTWHKAESVEDWNKDIEEWVNASGEELDVKDINQNAIWLRETEGYCNYYWFKIEKTD